MQPTPICISLIFGNVRIRKLLFFSSAHLACSNLRVEHLLDFCLNTLKTFCQKPCHT
ncbi:unnamed protein product [Rhodiola kirilowii]